MHFGVDTHPICDKCHMRHNPAGGCVKAELAMKAFELSGPIVKAVAQTELAVKQGVTKAKEKELRSSDVKVLENLAKEVGILASSLNKMFKQAESGHGKDKKIEYAKSRDCNRWLNGECNRKDCPFKHDPSKKGTNKSAGKPDSSDPKAGKTDVPRGVVVDEKDQDCKFWARGACTKGDKCRNKHDPAKGRPHDPAKKDKVTDPAMQEIITRLAQLEAAGAPQTFSGPSAAVVQNASRDILSIPERSKRAAEAAGIISYRSDVRSGAARAEFTGIIMTADNFAQDGERELVQDGERELVLDCEMALGRAPSTELSAGRIQQRPYARIFEYEYQDRGPAIRIVNDITGASATKNPDVLHQREEQGIKHALAHIVAAREYFEAAVGSVQDSDQEVFDYMVRYREEICEMVPETYQMLQSENAFDDVELQDPLVVIKGDDTMLRVYCGEVVDGNHMWILHMPDDSSPHYNLRHQL